MHNSFVWNYENIKKIWRLRSAGQHGEKPMRAYLLVLISFVSCFAFLCRPCAAQSQDDTSVAAAMLRGLQQGQAMSCPSDCSTQENSAKIFCARLPYGSDRWSNCMENARQNAEECRSGCGGN
jgi:hypothetical protein